MMTVMLLRSFTASTSRHARMGEGRVADGDRRIYARVGSAIVIEAPISTQVSMAWNRGQPAQRMAAYVAEYLGVSYSSAISFKAV